MTDPIACRASLGRCGARVGRTTRRAAKLPPPMAKIIRGAGMANPRDPFFGRTGLDWEELEAAGWELLTDRLL